MLVIVAEARRPRPDECGEHPPGDAQPGLDLADVVEQGTGDLRPRGLGSSGQEPAGDGDRVAPVGVRHPAPQLDLRR